MQSILLSMGISPYSSHWAVWLTAEITSTHVTVTF